MKKRMYIGIITVALLLTGCGAHNQTLEDNYDLIAEYAAGILIDHAYYNEDRYEYKSDLENETTKPTEFPTENNTQVSTEQATQENVKPTQRPTQSSTENQTQEQTKPVNVSMSELIGITGTEVICKKVIVTKEYTPDNILVITADSGRKFVVFELQIKNVSTNDITVTTSDDLYKLDTGKSSYKVFASGLLNELPRLENKTIKAGEIYDAVMIFNISEKDNVDNMQIISPAGLKSKVSIN